MAHIPEREIQKTADGSHTLFIPSMNEHYHSVNGAIQESHHVFIEAGYKQVKKRNILLFEVGFGTGLNALLTLREAEKEGKQVLYHTIELYPLEKTLTDSLNYSKYIWPEHPEFFEALHNAPWNIPVEITPCFTIHKIQGDIHQYNLPSGIDLIYFDAFAPGKQPEIWSAQIFGKLYDHASAGAHFITYCAKGEVRRQLQASGFTMERLPGPPGKRHILRGTK